MALTDTAIRNAKPRSKPYKLSDSLGLFVLVQPSGGKLWRLKYRFDGREKKLGFGAYPEVSLIAARKQRDRARELIAVGKDPSREKQQAKHRAMASAANTFGEIAREFIDKRRREGLSASTADKSEYYISRMGPVIARLPIAEIAAPDLLAVLRRIEAKGNYETAGRVLQLAGRVFRYAVATARLASDPSRMKMGKAHLVPLSRQSVERFRQIHAITGPAGYVFPSIRTRLRPMSENTINAGLRRLGFTGDEMTAHGFRAMASTLLNESGKWNPDAIERALAHGDEDKVRAAYHRGTHWKERVEMAQWWSDYLDQLRKGADVVPFPERKAS
ncbi:MAG: integrase arm-type DNA-binding domain-containing protein [Sphingomonadales bacterium]|nr:integrase arm-type DNA-binding domain-containing protein [Sphingomonadales bacterium]